MVRAVLAAALGLTLLSTTLALESRFNRKIDEFKL